MKPTGRKGMMLAICTGAFLSHFTAGVVNVALPGLVATFGTDIGTVQWITTGYLLVICILLPLMGKLGDRFGHRTVHNLGFLSFSIFSTLVAVAPNLSLLLVFRMLQAAGAAMFQATNIALLTLHHPKEQRGRALGIVNSAVAIGAMAGPIIGGMIAQWLSWRLLFFIHVPVALAATWMAYRYIPKQGLAQKPVMPDGARTGIFARHILKLPTVRAGLLVSLISFALANTLLVVLPFYLTGEAGFSSAAVGYVMTSYPVVLAVIGPIAGTLSDRYGSERLILLGLTGMGIGALIPALVLNDLSLAGMIMILILSGIGMGFIASPNNSFIISRVPPTLVGAIGGMIALTRNAGMVLGAVLGLGLLNGLSGETGMPSSEAYHLIFASNVLICFTGVALFAAAARQSKITSNEGEGTA